MLYGWKENSMLTNCLAACTHLSSTVSQLFEPPFSHTAAHIFVSPGDATLNVVWMEREFDAYKLSPVCAYLTITVSEIQWNICEKNRHFIIPLAFDAPVRGFPSEYRHPLWDGKTRMVSLSDGEKISKISLFVLAQLTNVSDAQRDRRTDTGWRQ